MNKQEIEKAIEELKDYKGDAFKETISRQTIDLAISALDDCIEVKGYDGNYYCISIDEREDRLNPNTGKIERKNEVFDSI